MQRHLLNVLTALSLLLLLAVAAAVVWAIRNPAGVLVHLPWADGSFVSSYHNQLCVVDRGVLVARDHGCSLPAALVPAGVFVPLWVKQARRDARARRRRRGQCPHCGYDLSGNASGVCPECGETVA